MSKRTRRDRDDDQGPTVGEASGIRDGDSVLDHLKRVRPGTYGGPTVEMLRRDLDRIVGLRLAQRGDQHT